MSVVVSAGGESSPARTRLQVTSTKRSTVANGGTSDVGDGGVVGVVSRGGDVAGTASPDLDAWRRDVRAKVTALKCHVMASRGLTPEGHIVPPYSPRVLLASAANAPFLLDAAQLDIENYTELLKSGQAFLQAAQGAATDEAGGDGGGSEAKNGTSEAEEDEERGKGEEDGEADENGTLDAVSLKEVEFELTHDNGCGSSVNGLSPLHGGGGGGMSSCSTPALPSTPSMAIASPSKSVGCSPLSSPLAKAAAPTNGHAAFPPSHATHNGTPVGPKTPSRLEEVEEQLENVKEELKLKEEEVDRLGKIRDEVENELQDLTANLFQEAHGMVREANQRAASAERALREAAMQVEVLQAEVTALKALVLTSTPAAPNPHLHPQLINKGASDSGKKMFQRGHRKSPSDFDLKYGRDTTPPSSPLKDQRPAHATPPVLDPESWECVFGMLQVDPIAHKEFVTWKQKPTLERSDPFMQRVYEEDIDLCLAFPNSMLAHRVQKAIEDNDIFIEEVNPRQRSSCPKKCVLLDVPRFCKYRFRLGESEDHWYYISQLARNRIAAVCDFLNYLRYILLGLVKSSIHDVYWEIVKLRRQMALARLGF
ncbi:uncharacterized protein LOC143037953 isoform X2 [Oratosquilla oratoria]|uniref:uncharacterized protein LOC143037953 isoform X2 n=1 Tax=Oratosquilla oratoria TaxID=337810 RepID=UPI003F769816